MRTRLVITCFLAALLGPDWNPAGAEEYYFELIFGSESTPKQLRSTHTWATFVKAVGEGPDLSNYRLEVNTISWLPQTLDVRVWRLAPEPGVNLDLYKTLAVVRADGQDVTMWGPLLTTREVYNRSVRVAQRLRGGGVFYRAIDGPSNPDITDCIHAVAMVDPVNARTHYPLVRVGKPASEFIAEQSLLHGYARRSREDLTWLTHRLALDRYAIETIRP